MSDGTGGSDESDSGEQNGHDPSSGQPGEGQHGQQPSGQGQAGSGQGQSPGGYSGGGQATAGGQGGAGGHGQPAGGQGQPAGGQTQPTTGQGQQASGYQQPQAGAAGPGQQPVNQANIGDAFSNPAVLTQIQTVLTLYAVTGFALGVSGFMLVNQFAGFGSSAPGVARSAVGVPLLIGAVIAVLLGHRVGRALVGEPDEFAFVSAGVACLAGNFVMAMLAVVMASFGSGRLGLDFVSVFAVLIVGSVVAGLAGAGGAFAGIVFDDGTAPR